MTQTAPQNSNLDEVVLIRENIGPIARLTLNKPEKYNTLSRVMLAQLQSSLDDLANDESIRVIILAANGKAFCAGHDLKELHTQHEKNFAQLLFAECNRVMVTMMQLPQPVIAQVQGVATAAGCQLVANCDLAIASTDARFAVSGVNLGLFCSTPSVALSRNISRKSALEMLLTGDFIDADTALEKCLVNRLCEPQQLTQATLAFAQSIACKPREVLALGKQLFYAQVDHEMEHAYALASERMACNLGFPSAIEGIDAFIEKRQPAWNESD